MSSPPLLQARDLTFGYHAGAAVLSGLSAELHPGRVTVLLGPNAAGKSTLLRLLLGQATPWAGSVTLDGREVSSLSPAQRAARVSFVPQRAGASFAFSVQQVVEMGRFALPPDPRAIGRALQWCDLEELRDRIYSELSAGQQQRVLLARAMAQASGPEPRGKVMLLDEPVSAMDLWHIHRTMQLLASLARHGLAVLVVLHDLNLAVRYADDVWLMDRGALIARGPWAQVLVPNVLEPVYRVSLRAVAQDEDGRPVFAARMCDTVEATTGSPLGPPENRR